MGKRAYEDKSKHYIAAANMVERSFTDVKDINTAIRLTLILLSSYGFLSVMKMTEFRLELEKDVLFNEGRKRDEAQKKD